MLKVHAESLSPLHAQPTRMQPAIRVVAVTLLVLVASLLGSSANAQLPPKETVRSMSVANGFEVKLFASEPMISNPIAIDVDTYGRVWVTEGVDYRRAKKDPPEDRIKVLEDTDGDGVADKMTIFTSDLNSAMGICVAGSKIYVPESPNLYLYEDKNGDLKPDGPRKTLLTGFGGYNHDHGVHSQMFGPDHKLYMTNGDTGFDVTGPDGSHIQFQWGAMIRCEGDGSQLHAFAVNFRNPVELAVDSFGNVWCSDNDNDGLKSTRICWILEGGNYGWFGRPEMIRNPDGSFDPIHHWRADKPGFVPYVAITGFGSPCGMTFYEGNAFGSEFQGRLFHCDAGPQEIRSYAPYKLDGVGYSVSMMNVVTSPDRYFRPVDVCAAPDGSLYTTDWYDGGVGGHAFNDPGRGRIYRITPKGKTVSRTEKPGPYDNNADALVALASPNLATQYLARERLLESGVDSIPALTKLVDGKNHILKARALWLLDRIGGEGRTIVQKQLKSKNPKFRALAVRILRRRLPDYEADILGLADDRSSEVLREVLISIPKMKSKRATNTLVDLFTRYEGKDRYLLEALHIAAKGREDIIFERVVDSSDAVIDERIVNLVRILRPDNATTFLSKMLADANLPAASRQSLLAALTSVATPAAGKSTAQLLAGDAPIGLKRLALKSLRQNLNGPWSSLKETDEIQAGLQKSLDNPQLTTDALAVVGAANLKKFGKRVVEILKRKSSDTETQLAAIHVSGRLGLNSAGSTLASLLASKNSDIRSSALKALVEIRDTKTLAKVLSSDDYSTDMKKKAVDELVTSSDGAVFLLRMIDTKQLTGTLAKTTINAAVQHPDVNVRLLFEKFIPESQRPKTLGESFTLNDILKLKGDGDRGKSVYLRSGAASCIKCHRIKGQGLDIGPDLSQIGRKYAPKALLETIMQPSKGIAPEYVPYVVATESGKVYAGFIQQRTENELVLKTIKGEFLRISKDEVDELVKQEKSLMPELVLKNVTAQDAADLLAYLSSLQDVEKYATQFAALGPFANDQLNDRTTDFGPESSAAAIDLKAVYPGLAEKKVKWQTTSTRSYAGSTPQIVLSRLTSAAKVRSNNVIYYFALNIDSTVEQKAKFNIGSDDGIQVWLNGEKIHNHKITRALKAGDDSVSVMLKQGTNSVLLKLDQGGGSAGLSFAVEARANITFRLP